MLPFQGILMFGNHDRGDILVKAYIKDCKKLFPIYGKEEKRYLDSLKEQILEYESTNSAMSYEQLIEEFGEPTEVIVDYYKTVGEYRILEKINVRRKIRSAVFLVGSVTVLFFCYLYWCVTDLRNTGTTIIKGKTTYVTAPPTTAPPKR